MRGRAGRLVVGAMLAVAVLLAASGCVDDASSEAPITLQLSAIQSGTVHLGLNQVARIDLGASGGHYTALVADHRIVSVVQRRDETDGRLEPELVPLRVGTTQVALSSSGQQVIGFKVVITN